MNAPSDGMVELVFGLQVADGFYDASRGHAEYREGRLVRLRIGSQPGWENDAGLTVGFTAFPDIDRGMVGKDGYVLAQGETRVYVNGRLDSADSTGPVFLNPARL